MSISKMNSNFQKSEEIDLINKQIRNCAKCRLHKTRKKTVPGEGPLNAKIMIIGQAPGRNEDNEGKPFIGLSGKFLNKLLKSISLIRGEIFITSPIKCFPPNNRIPKSDELKACKAYLCQQIEIINPKVIVTLGSYALRTFFGKNFKITEIHGLQQKIDKILIFPTFHPAAALRFPKIYRMMEKDFEKFKCVLKKIT